MQANDGGYKAYYSLDEAKKLRDELEQCIMCAECKRIYCHKSIFVSCDVLRKREDDS
jgi:hypothetical protein